MPESEDLDETLLDAAESGDVEIMVCSLERGAAVNARDCIGETPLICAAEKGHTALVRLLLDAGANPNLSDDYGDTALLVAAAGYHLDVLRLLLGHGANPNAVNHSGFSALLSTSKTRKVERLWSMRFRKATMIPLICCVKPVRRNITAAVASHV